MLPHAQPAIVTARACCSFVLSSNTLFAWMLSRHLLPSLHRWWSYSCSGRIQSFAFAFAEPQEVPLRSPLLRVPWSADLPCHVSTTYSPVFATWKPSFCQLKNRVHPLLMSRSEDSKQYRPHYQPLNMFNQLPVRLQHSDHYTLCSCQATLFFTHFAVNTSALNILSLASMRNWEPKNHYGRVCWHITTNWCVIHKMAGNSSEQWAKHSKQARKWKCLKACPSALD